MAMADRLAVRAARVPGSVWIVLLVVVAWIFYAGVKTGGFNIPIERLPWSILVPGFAVFSFAHSMVLLGHKRALLLLVLCITLAFASEYIGERTGLIFGPSTSV